ncbi:unnamed protein product [Urochloa humidicola]
MAKDDMMLDMEKGLQEGMDAPANQVPPMAKEEDQGDLVLELMQVQQVEGVAVAGKMKWRPAYWLLVAASSVIVLAPSSWIGARPSHNQNSTLIRCGPSISAQPLV